MSGYTKLFHSILDSTIWQEDKETRLVFITMLAMKNRQQVVEASMPGLARRAGVSLEECEKALAVLKAPDVHSRSKEYEGRRIEEVEGGWKVLNGEKYRDMMSREERRAYKARKQQEYRDKKKDLERIRAENNEREKRFTEAVGRGDEKSADRIAAEGT